MTANGHEISFAGEAGVALELDNGKDCSFVNILLTICLRICKYISPLQTSFHFLDGVP